MEDVQQLMDAIAENRVDDVEKLLAAGVQVNSDVQGGCTPLEQALYGNNAELVRLLLDAGAWPDIVSNCHTGRLPVFIAAERHSLDMMALLLQAGADPNGHFSSAQILSGEKALTPLMIAAGEGDLPMAELLLYYGCDINAKDSWTCGNVLDYARCQAEDVALWQLLLDAGADPNYNRGDPLQRVCEETSPEILQLLLSSGADIKAVDYRGATCLITAVVNGGLCEQTAGQRIKVVRLLLEAGVDVTHRDKVGRNATQHALPRLNYSDEVNKEALRQVIALIQGELDRRKAAALSVLPEQMPPDIVRHLLVEAHIVGLPEEKLGPTRREEFEKLLELEGLFL